MDDKISDLNSEHSMGTSIMAIEFEGGVIMGADSRTTTGSYIANRVSNKITQVHDRIYCCRSGSASDTQAIADYVKYYLQIHGIEKNSLPKVKTAATLFKTLCYENKNNLQAGIICAGWDPINGGQVFNIPLGGSLIRQPFATGGSGSTYIYGYCDSKYKSGMSEKEAKEFVINGLALAMSRDGSSGGVIRLAIIKKDGVERETYSGEEIPKFFESE